MLFRATKPNKEEFSRSALRPTLLETIKGGVQMGNRRFDFLRRLEERLVGLGHMAGRHC